MTPFQSWFSPSFTWVTATELRGFRLVTSASPHLAGPYEASFTDVHYKGKEVLKHSIHANQTTPKEKPASYKWLPTTTDFSKH